MAKKKLTNNILRLSDAFRFGNRDFSMELTVKVIDVNYNSGSEILQKSPSLGGYAYLFDYDITYEEELEIKKEDGKAEGNAEGFLNAALKFLQKGTSFEDVIKVLDLSASQIMDLKNRIA